MCSVRRAAMRTPENLEGGKHYERVQFRRRLRLRLRLRKLDYHHTSALRMLWQRRRLRMLRDNHHHPSALLLRLWQQLRLRREARRIRLQIIHIKLISRAKKARRGQTSRRVLRIRKAQLFLPFILSLSSRSCSSVTSTKSFGSSFSG